jgi:lincosamide and streptogramin A transport system ATP-binding/permease protein
MSNIIIDSVDYYYDSPYAEVFSCLSIEIDTSWKTGIVGRNGRGKTTLLKLIAGEINAVKGDIHISEDVFYYPFKPGNVNDITLNVIKSSIAPFSLWEKEMEELIKKGDSESLSKYGEIVESYEKHNGYNIDSMIEKEIERVGLNHDILYQNFNTLSGGEQTRVLIISLFLRVNTFPLIDEPTNHLDMIGRKMLGEYLSNKKGFILVSHDRYFLDLCTDHIISINRNDTRINKGNFSKWKNSIDMEEEFERRKNENLKREIKSLKHAADQRKRWSFRKEKEKKGSANSGAIGHKSAKLMKTALNIEKRMKGKIEDKKNLLMNKEKERKLKLDRIKSPDMVLIINKINVNLGEKCILSDFSLSLEKGERIAIVGENGTGKTTLLNAICGDIKINKGDIYCPNYINYIRAYQIPKWQKGYLNDYLCSGDVNINLFRNIMGVLGVGGEIFDRPLETFSMGERKKVDLCRSFISPVNFLLWDEPLNYIDLFSRQQIEDVILKYKPTMIFIEHDKYFIEKVATRIVNL